MNISFARAVTIFGVAVLSVLAALIGLYYYLENRPIDVEPIAVYGTPAEIFEAGSVENLAGLNEFEASSAYGASTFIDAVARIESGVGLASYEGQSFLRSSSKACEGYEPSIRPEDWTSSLRFPEVEGRGEAMRSLQMVIYFQSVFCSGVYQAPEVSDRAQLLEHVHDLALRSTDSDTLEILALMAPIWQGLHPDEFNLDLGRFSDLASRTSSPAVFYESAGFAMSNEESGLISSRHTALLKDDQEVRHARAVGLALARCEIFVVCRPMGLSLMAVCAPYRCPADGSIKTFYESQYSDEVIAAANGIRGDLVSARRGSRN